MPAEQVMERVAQSTAQAPQDRTDSPLPHGEAAHRDHEAEATFSPDPQQRTDRYRLVTPYLLRL